MLRSFTLILLGLVFAGGSAAADFSTLEERMSAAEFKAAGLDKLSQSELVRLNQWLQANGLASARTAPAASEARTPMQGFRAKDFLKDGDRVAVNSRLKGRFTGWSGSSTFELANGQVWKQTEGDSFVVRAMESPAVTIEPKALGTWMLKVEGYNRGTMVTRIE